jgi:hypothetical protein
VRGSVAQCGVGPWRQGRMRFQERSSQGQTNHFGEAGRASPAETSGDQGQPLSDWCACTLVETSGTLILGVSMRRLPLGVRECSLRAFDVSHDFNHQNRPAGDVFARLLFTRLLRVREAADARRHGRAASVQSTPSEPALDERVLGSAACRRGHGIMICMV